MWSSLFLVLLLAVLQASGKKPGFCNENSELSPEKEDEWEKAMSECVANQLGPGGSAQEDVDFPCAMQCSFKNIGIVGEDNYVDGEKWANFFGEGYATFGAFASETLDQCRSELKSGSEELTDCEKISTQYTCFIHGYFEKCPYGSSEEVEEIEKEIEEAVEEAVEEAEEIEEEIEEAAEVVEEIVKEIEEAAAEEENGNAEDVEEAEEENGNAENVEEEENGNVEDEEEANDNAEDEGKVEEAENYNAEDVEEDA